MVTGRLHTAQAEGVTDSLAPPGFDSSETQEQKCQPHVSLIAVVEPMPLVG